jgi:hypothetical protein
VVVAGAVEAIDGAGAAAVPVITVVVVVVLAPQPAIRAPADSHAESDARRLTVDRRTEDKSKGTRVSS